jgi:hypothetical protein
MPGRTLRLMPGRKLVELSTNPNRLFLRLKSSPALSVVSSSRPCVGSETLPNPDRLQTCWEDRFSAIDHHLKQVVTQPKTVNVVLQPGSTGPPLIVVNTVQFREPGSQGTQTRPCEPLGPIGSNTGVDPYQCPDTDRMPFVVHH